MRNGRALSSTVPATRLPMVCCAARPMMTAVIAPPTASVSRSRPASRRATSTLKQQGQQAESGSPRSRRRPDRAVSGAQGRWRGPGSSRTPSQGSQGRSRTRSGSGGRGRTARPATSKRRPPPLSAGAGGQPARALAWRAAGLAGGLVGPCGRTSGSHVSRSERGGRLNVGARSSGAQATVCAFSDASIAARNCRWIAAAAARSSATIRSATRAVS
jgi:hypothetical protein